MSNTFKKKWNTYKTRFRKRLRARIQTIAQSWAMEHLLEQFGQFGPHSRIDLWVNLKGETQGIQVGSHVALGRNATLECTKGSTIEIGDHTHIGPASTLATCGGHIRIGQDCSINPNCVLYGHGGLDIGNYVRIAANTVIIASSHLFENPEVPITQQGLRRRGIVIEDDVWIDVGARIMDGCRIGKGSVVAAGSVVTKDVEPYSLVAGVPARLIRKRGEAEYNSRIQYEPIYKKALLYEADDFFKETYDRGLIVTGTPDNGDKRRERFYNLIQLLQQTLPMTGEIAECGVWKGLSSYLMNHCLRLKNPAHQGEGYSILDSFEGLSQPQEQDQIDLAVVHKDQIRTGTSFKEAGGYAVGLKEVQAALAEFPAIAYYPGWIPDSLDQVPEQSYKFVHVDLDLYEPILGALEYFYPRMVPGGIILCDDYGSLYWPGARKAVEEFCECNDIAMLALSTGQAVLWKASPVKIGSIITMESP